MEIKAATGLIPTEICAESWPWETEWSELKLWEAAMRDWRMAGGGHWAVASRAHKWMGAAMAKSKSGRWYFCVLVADWKEWNMSDTPRNADECKRLLDNGWRIKLWRNSLGSYSARATRAKLKTRYAIINDAVTTDDFEPSQALYRLTEKVFGNIV
jgi:hypothetical protein